MGRALQSRLMRPVRGVGVRQDFEVDTRCFDIREHPEQTPIVINSFNRLGYLRGLVAALRSRGYENIYVIDNCSTYEPLLRYYEASGLRVFYLDRNVGYLALWTTPIGALFVDGYYAYTDSDIEPVPECPDDFMAFFRDALLLHPEVDKVGFGLEVEDLPATYAMRDEVVAHERRVTKGQGVSRLYKAPIDTTFALYRPGAAGGFWLSGMRTGRPYLARHMPWYADSSHPDEEEVYYRSTARTSTHWTLVDQGEASRTMVVSLWDEPVRVVANQEAPMLNMVWRPERQPATYDALDRLIKDGCLYLELGSGIGQTALYAARRAGMVYAVECDPAKFAVLEENVSLNADTLGNIVALDTRIAARPVPGRSVSFADFEAGHPLDDCCLVKIDLGRSVYTVLPAMIPFLKRVRPGLHVTLYPRRLFRIKGSGTLARAALRAASLVSTAYVMWLLRFYRCAGDIDGAEVRLLDRRRLDRSTFTLTFSDAAAGEPRE